MERFVKMPLNKGTARSVLLLLVLLFNCFNLIAQDVTVRGKDTEDQGGDPQVLKDEA